MNGSQIEAANLFKYVLEDCFKGTQEIGNDLRRCQHACEILNWQEQKVWFKNESEGYPKETEIPWYRKIKGEIKWVPEFDFTSFVSQMYEGFPKIKTGRLREISFDVWWGIENILYCAQKGYSENTGKRRKATRQTRYSRVEEETKIYEASQFQNILRHINNSVFSFASSAYSTVCYSDNILDILQTYRSKVDDYLVRSGFKEHLDAVRAGLSSDNPQEWRNNMLGCRNIIRDLAGHLWRDPRDTYIYLPGSGKDGKLPVTEDKYVNRLGAYLLHP